MSLEFTSVPPVPRGMNLAGPPLFIGDAYCRWMQDVLVDRPGQIRMRGPLTKWYTGSTFTAGQQAIGAAETVTPSGEWRGAVFATGSSTTDGVLPTSAGLVKVFDKNSALVGTITLPFNFNTKWSSANNHWNTSTIIDAKPALGGGVWIGVTDEYGVITDTVNSKQALMLWRGAGKATYSESAKTYTPDDKNITVTTGSNVESGMFVFDTTADTNGYGRYLGVVAIVNSNTVTLEKEPLVTSTSASAVTGRTLMFTSLRGFVHQHGRGVATTDGGLFITSGRLGSDAEGLFGAARVTIGASAGTHTVYAYRYSDHQFIGEIKHNGTVSNTQVEMEAATFSTVNANFLKDDNYLIGPSCILLFRVFLIRRMLIANGLLVLVILRLRAISLLIVLCLVVLIILRMLILVLTLRIVFLFRVVRLSVVSLVVLLVCLCLLRARRILFVVVIVKTLV